MVIVMKNSLWEKFKQTGEIKYYMQYKKAEDKKPTK